MPRKLLTWKLKNREIRLGDRTLLMGVLNVTPDSFSDGGQYLDPDRAFARALELEEQGADIIDIGAESTRPGSARIPAAEEIRRLIPVLKRLKGNLRVPVSVDTYKAEVAELALEHGAEIINDPSGFTWDPLIAKVVVRNDAGLILNHMRGTPETWAKLGPLPDVMLSISKDLDASISRARRSGVDRLRIVIDPGLGFGKRKEQNAEIIARLGELARLDYPIMAGPSRKSFLAQALERETQFAGAAAVAAAVLGGAHIVRVHDVAEMRSVLTVADEILRAIPAPREEEAARKPHEPVSRQSARKFAAPPGKDRPRLEPPRLIRGSQTPPPPAQVPPPEPPPQAAPPLAPPRPAPPPRFVPDKPRPDRFTRPGPRTPGKFGPRRSGPPGSSPPRSGPPRSGPPGSGPPRSGPPKFGSSRSGPPRSGPPRKFGRPRNDPPKSDT